MPSLKHIGFTDHRRATYSASFICKMADHRERDSYYSQTDLRSKNDDPPNSRLFVICHKSLEEDDLRKAFEKFGKIEDIWVVKDRTTGENKGNFSCLHKKSIRLYFLFNHLLHIFKFIYIHIVYL